MITRVILLLSISISSFGMESKTYNEFKEIHKLSYLYRMQIAESYVHLKGTLDRGERLSARDINLINQEIKKRYDLGKRGVRFLESLEKKFRRYKNNKSAFIDVASFLGTFVSMADSYFFAYDQLARNYKIRRLLDEENLSNDQKKGVFKKSIKQLFSYRTRGIFIKAVSLFNKYNGQYLFDSKVKNLKKVIESSFTFKQRKSLGFEKGLVANINFIKMKWRAFKSNAFFEFRQATMRILFNGSKLFGNTAGLFASRKGKLFQDRAFITKSLRTLRPLDALLEKTPFRLTDKFIPGFWGHAAIYVGSEAQLKRLGIWKHPQVMKYHQQIRAGRNIVEALRSGVEINSMKSFSNIDDFAILRLKNELSLSDLKSHLIRVFSQIGKEYDFGFNVETSSKIVCSELHYLTYENIQFEIEYILGQPTISVDSVAKQGLPLKAFKPLSLYLDGEEVTLGLKAQYAEVLELANKKSRRGIVEMDFDQKVQFYFD